MPAITERELNQHTAAMLDRVTDSEEVVVTERGKPRWRVSVVRDQDTVLARFEREGRYTPPASTPAPWADRQDEPAYTDTDVDALLDGMRGGPLTRHDAMMGGRRAPGPVGHGPGCSAMI